MSIRNIDSAEALAAYQLECQLSVLKRFYKGAGTSGMKAYQIALCQQGITCMTMLGIPSGGPLTSAVIACGGDVLAWIERTRLMAPFVFDDTNALVRNGHAILHRGVMLITDFCDDPDRLFDVLLHRLNFEYRENSPRRELYFNDLDVPYTYGNPLEGKTFYPQPWDSDVLAVRDKLSWLLGCPFEVCFVNCYDHHRHHLGWHADDSPEMDDGRPIVTVSLGAEREIWFRPNGGGNEDVVKVSLPNGSACIMPPGYQDTHQHRIPKHSAECGPRISLTFRGYTSS